VPKALLPVSDSSDDTILGTWWREVKSRQLFTECFLVVNAHQFKYFERWATANGFPAENIINDGTTTHEGRLGAAADLDLVKRRKGLEGADAMIIAGDMLISQGFDISGVQRFFRLRGGDVAVYYELAAEENAETRGIVNARTLALLPDGAIVVNTARGDIVDDDALIAALSSGKLAAAVSGTLTLSIIEGGNLVVNNYWYTYRDQTADWMATHLGVPRR
jgi:hypothetical protein